MSGVPRKVVTTGPWELADLVLQKMPEFGDKHPGLLDRLQVVKQRAAVAEGIKQFLLRPYELSHQVS